MYKKSITTKTALMVAFASLPVWMLGTGMAYSYDCFNRATTKLERAYCEIKKEGYGRSLPALEDFKKNSNVVQRLLLKRDAATLGIDLSEPKKQNPTTAEQPALSKPREVKTAEKPTQPTRQQSGTQKPTPPAPLTPTREGGTPSHREVSTTSNHPLSACRIERQSISCLEGRYSVARNKRNRDVSQAVLRPENRLTLSRFSGDPSDETVVRTYLRDAYLTYIQKMLDIGLAESTMTYRKFYYIFRYAKEQDTNFTERFEQMYEHLKKDKLTMASGTKGRIEMPKDLEYCARLNDAIMLCDHDNRNIIFLKE